MRKLIIEIIIIVVAFSFSVGQGQTLSKERIHKIKNCTVRVILEGGIPVGS